jgi:hypothetical protein
MLPTPILLGFWGKRERNNLYPKTDSDLKMHKARSIVAHPTKTDI